ncbi:MAG: DUF6430 domain-containing protein [Prevotella sp.]|jgi:hypothetical protein|nr:DUF6430 domain-containing protein [Prevotella sp.]
MWTTRIKNNLPFIAKRACSLTAAIYAFIGFLGAFVSLEGVFSSKDTFWYKLLISILILLGIWGLTALFICLYVLLKKKKKVVDGMNGHAVYVIYGDLFDEKILGNNSERRNLCFAVNRCFDTIVDDEIVAKTTIHGKAFNKLYVDGTYTPDSLNTNIQNKLEVGNVHFMNLTTSDKRRGNLKRYDVGTTVDLRISDSLHYFMVGMSTYDRNLTANTTLLDFDISIQKLIDFCNEQSQGYPVIMPILGGGLSRTSVNEKELLDYIISAFKLNTRNINFDVYIVIRESAKGTISIADLLKNI